MKSHHAPPRRARRRRAAEAAVPQATSPAAQPHEHAATLAHPELGFATRAATLADMQRTGGNAHVERLLAQREPGTALAPAHTTAIAQRDDPPGAAGPDPALAAFLGQRFEKKNFHPSTGRGLFDATYVPRSGELTITVKVAFEFKNGSSNPEDTWQPDEERAWAQRAIADVQNAWGHQYTFHYHKAGWESLPPVNVNVQVLETATDKAHYVTTVNKRKTESADRDEVVPPGRRATQSTATFHESEDGNGIETPDVDQFSRSSLAAHYATLRAKNPNQVFFTVGRAELKPTDHASVRDFAAELAKPEIPPFPVTVTGRASTDGGTALNQSLSEQRAREVSNQLVQGGAKKQPTVNPQGEAAAGPGPEWRRAEISLGSFESAQDTVMHEFGHMFGLADEYVDGARTPGSATRHSALVASLMPDQEPVVAADNENIMSLGTTVRPHHYVTFLEVLSSMSGTEAPEWKTQPAVGPRPGTRGDFPLPRGDTHTV